MAIAWQRNCAKITRQQEKFGQWPWAAIGKPGSHPYLGVSLYNNNASALKMILGIQAAKMGGKLPLIEK